MAVIPLPNGEKATIRDPTGLTGDDVENVLGLAGTVGINPKEVGKTEFLRLIGVLRRALVVTLTESWTLPGEITMESVGALPVRSIRPLYQAIEPALADVMPEELDPNSTSAS
jgi:hypothetical protein